MAYKKLEDGVIRRKIQLYKPIKIKKKQQLKEQKSNIKGKHPLKKQEPKFERKHPSSIVNFLK